MSQNRPPAPPSHPSHANHVEGTPPRDPPPPDGQAGSGRPRRPVLLRTVALAAALALLAVLLIRLRGLMIEDDAFIFVRYAENLLRHGILAWNPQGPPTYGTTSILYTGGVFLVRVVVGDAPARVAVLSSLLCGIAFVLLITRAVWRQGDLPASARGRAGLAAFLLVPVAWSADVLTAHFVTGMDTTFALAALSGMIVVAAAFERQPAGRRGAALAAATGLAFFVRPDLLTFSLPLLVAVAMRSPERVPRPTAAWIVAASLTTTALGCALAWAYFGTPVPLSFYVKGVVRYGGDLEASYAAVPGEQLGLFLRSYGWWMIPIVIRLVRDARRRRWSCSGVESALLLGIVVFVVYYRFFVLQVMPHYQRFYYPVLPALVFLAARSATEIDPEPAAALTRRLAWFESPTRAAAVTRLAVALALLVPCVGPVHRALGRAWAQRPFWDLRAMDNLGGSPSRYWFHLPEFASLPDDLVTATTEIGTPGVLFPNKRIIDLSGLNDAAFARHGLDPSTVFGVDRPDLVYMPHPDYRIMTQRILADPTFRREYELYPARVLRTGLALALRKTSPHYEAMRDILYAGNTRRARPD